MHPVIRLACFVLLLLGLATTHQILLVITAPGLLWLLGRYSAIASILPLLKRLRWLWLSLFILHLWFSAPEWMWIPSLYRVWEATERIIALVMIMLAAHLLVVTTPISPLIAALQWWLMPLQRLGWPTHRLSVRLALVLDTVQTVQQLFDKPKSVTSTQFVTPKRVTARLNQMSERVAYLFVQVLEHAETTPLQVLEIPELFGPPWWQWLYPVLMLALIVKFP